MPTDTRGICYIRELPASQRVKAAERAVKVNPDNSPEVAAGLSPERAQDMTPQRLAVLTSKYWGAAGKLLTVSFTEGQSAAFRDRLLAHMNAWWDRGANFRFVWTAGVGQVRISTLDDGYWSYLGTDVGLIPTNEPTMNLGGFTLTTPAATWTRVTRHEVGHTMGFPHEHLRKEIVGRIDEAKAIAYFGGPPNNWTEQQTRHNVLTPLRDEDIIAGTVDPRSIMAYSLPASIMRDGVAVPGGSDITTLDRTFAAARYPKPSLPPLPGGAVYKLVCDNQTDGKVFAVAPGRFVHIENWVVFDALEKAGLIGPRSAIVNLTPTEINTVRSFTTKV